VERHQQVIRSLTLAAITALVGGCLQTKPVSKTGGEPPAQAGFDPAVEQASAKVPALVPSASLAALAKASVGDLPKGSATEIATAWQPKVAELPDPTKNGAPIRGVVGQMFLFGADYQFAAANGRVVVEMFDQTGAKPDETGPRLGTWTFEKDALKKLVSMDERLGRCYTIFLPWPEYNPAVGRVKLTLRYDPERGYPLYAPASPLTLDRGENKAPIHTQRAVSGLDVAGFSGPSAPPSEPRALPPLDPLPVGGRNAAPTPPGNTPLGMPRLK
jgi:hypothetical protein